MAKGRMGRNINFKDTRKNPGVGSSYSKGKARGKGRQG